MDTRRRSSRAELEGLGSTAIGPLLDKLIAERLLTSGQEGIEVAHEALIREWKTLREWIGADRDVLRLHQELSRDTGRWVEGGRKDDDLWRGTRLGRAVEALEAGRLVLSPEEREFVAGARAVEARERRRRRTGLVAKRLAWTAALAVAVTLAASAGRPAWTWWTLPRGLEWVRIPPPPGGKFWMGCVPNDKCQEDEIPRFEAALARGFDLMAHEVTFTEFRRFSDGASSTIVGRWLPTGGVAMADQPEWNKPDHPVVNVSWSEAAKFCRFVGGRLPRESEWEYAARGGHGDWVYPWGNDYSNDHANGDGVGGRDRWRETAPVKSFPPNGFGLHDMAGNVWEWTSTEYGRYPYRQNENRKDHDSIEARVVRGGSFDFIPRYLRVSGRYGFAPDGRYVNLGFRCARDVSP